MPESSVEGSSKPKVYRGTLTPFQIADGIRCCKAHAERLQGDAQMLFENERYPTAMAVAILAIEEVGKLPILRRMALAGSASQWGACWRDFADHFTKSLTWMLTSVARDYPEGGADGFHRKYLEERDLHLLNSLKQVGLYVGCYGKGKWVEPSSKITRDVASFPLHLAKMLLAGSRPSSFDTPTAIQRWSEYMDGLFLTDFVSAHDRIADFLEGKHSKGIEIKSTKIPPDVALSLRRLLHICRNPQGSEKLDWRSTSRTA